jgi:hypothetical protein
VLQKVGRGAGAGGTKLICLHCLLFRNLHALGYSKPVTFFYTTKLGWTSASAWCVYIVLLGGPGIEYKYFDDTE